MTSEVKIGLAHCQHHNVHWGLCFNYNERVLIVKANKPIEEQETRLRWFQLVPEDMIPGKDSPEWLTVMNAGLVFDKFWQEYKKDWKVYCETLKTSVSNRPAYKNAKQVEEKSWKAKESAWQMYDEVWQVFEKIYVNEFNQLHQKLFPDCPWDGKTIFAKGDMK